MSLAPLFNRCAYKPSTPLALVSAPGQGKTQMVEAWCKRNNRTLVKLLASSLDETDVSGVIVPKDGHAVTLSPQWLPQLGNNGVLFLDECNCFPGDTEILTDKGFVRFDELEDDAVVAQIDEKQEITFVKPEKVHRIDYEGELIHITNDEVEMLMTPNHRVAYRTEKHGQLKIMTAEEAYKMAGEENGKEIMSTLFYIPSHGFVNGEPISSEPVIDYWIWSTDFSKEQYKGKVYCVTVPTGMFIARYKKSTFVTGNCARKEVQDTLLTLVQSRHMPNGDRIPDGVMIVAAMNPSEMCDNYEMSPAMKTRFMWCHLRTSFNQTIQWLTSDEDLFADIPAPSTYQTFGEWHERFRKDKSFESDKKALLQELSKLGFDYTPDEEFADEELGSCARNFCNLMYWTQNALEVLQWASAFVSDKAAEVIRTVNVASFRTTGNQVFGNRRSLTDVNDAENENINNRQNVMNNIMNEVNQA